MPHVDQTTDDGVQADTRAAVEGLRGLGVHAVFTVGFCFGGRALVGGGGLRPRSRRRGRLLRRADARARRREPGARVGEIACPILALQAGDDPNITAEDNAAFDEALTGAGVEHEIVSTKARRTASSTASRRSSRRTPTTPGGARSSSSPRHA